MNDITISWCNQIVALTSKLNKACYTIRAVRSCTSLDVLRMIYFLMYTQLSHMVLFFGVTHILVLPSLKFKKGY
jgi:hypothetical protein